MFRNNIYTLVVLAITYVRDLRLLFLKFELFRYSFILQCTKSLTKASKLWKMSKYWSLREIRTFHEQTFSTGNAGQIFKMSPQKFEILFEITSNFLKLVLSRSTIQIWSYL